MESNVLLRIFSLDHFLVLKLEARLLAVFSTQDDNAVLLGERRKTAGLRDQLQHRGLRVERISAGPCHLTGDKGALAPDLHYRDRDLRVGEETFQLFRDQVLN